MDKTRINEMIRESEVRVIDQDGEHKGVIPLAQALQLAADAGMDLVEVATGTPPHVCRIMDYGHYKFEQAKRQKLAKKKQKVIVVKEIKMRPRTDDHDYNFKLNHARRFMEQGSKVKFTVLFRGREMAHKDRGRDVLDRVEADLADIAAVESKPRMEGRTLFMVMAPLNKPKIAPKGDSEEPLESNELETVPEAVSVEDSEGTDSDELDL